MHFVCGCPSCRMVSAILAVYLGMVGEPPLGRGHCLWDPSKSLFLVWHTDSRRCYERRMDSPPPWLRNVLYDISSADVVVVRGINVYDEDDDMCSFVLRYSRRSTVLEIMNVNYLFVRRRWNTDASQGKD